MNNFKFRLVATAAVLAGCFDYLDAKEFPNAKSADPKNFYDNTFVDRLAKSGFLKNLGMK